MYQRKTTLVKSLTSLRPKKTKTEKTGRLRGRYLFRAIIRFIINNIDWIKEQPFFAPDEDIVEDSLTKIKNMNKRTSADGQIITSKNRSFLLSKPHLRDKSDKISFLSFIKSMNAFDKYPDDNKQSIAAVCCYQFLQKDRVIVRQGDPARFLYFILKGQVTLSKFEKNNVTDEEKVMTMGMMGPGDSFGEVALLHCLPRAMTVTTKTPVELLFITKHDFDQLLRENLLKNWNVLQEALVTFNYFNEWDEATIRECCILSKIKNFTPNEVILGDGRGLTNHVYFLLDGKCQVVEHLLVYQEKHHGYIKYKLFDPEEYKESKKLSHENIHIDDNNEKNNQPTTSENKKINNKDEDEEDDDEKEDHNYKKVLRDFKGTPDQVNTLTLVLQDIINQWHLFTGIAEALLYKPKRRVHYEYPDYVNPVFMQICQLTKGACFGIGEPMDNRRVISLTPVRCLLIPKNWLFKYNRSNIWKRIELFLNSKYPTRDELFKKFKMNKRWIIYKKKLINDILKNGRKIKNNTTIDDVPYSIRVKEV
ncbi:hypothetical protein HCN44_010489 [Aphidius gifuensis]|uniref:Cyclic nucleotide-binding domain-containing protein n=1 Tax=Aphidius gifuensis TaxID=684658 RepID=A0A834XSF0_APHGI|nr:uncharacterized protein LOC122854035 [Aphidius gifuensis]KAF7991688.1 hypothetical protein HCN44_010489 [Aphidius gifuensis]